MNKTTQYYTEITKMKHSRILRVSCIILRYVFYFLLSKLKFVFEFKFEFDLGFEGRFKWL